MKTEDDAEAFTRLVREHQSMVYSLVWHMVGDAAVAEEVAQDVFCELYRHWERLESERHALFWLRQVAARRAIDQMRRRRLRAWIGLDAIPEPAAPARASDPWQEQRLRDAVARLEPEQARAIVLRYQEGLDPMEIAALTGERLHTVKSRLQRGLRKLRGMMGDARNQATTESRR